MRGAEPVAIVDIGSNSVRLVAYEALSRSPAAILNEKVLCGLGRGVATTGLLADEAMDRALSALRAFRVMCRNMGIADLHVLATAATRDARNGAGFLRAAAEAVGTRIDLIDGAREAELSALGVVSGFHRADGVVGDMGGGSLELVDVDGDAIGRGASLPLGGLALRDSSRGSAKRAVRIARDLLEGAAPVRALEGRTFYAVGGTWRALAKLHMRGRAHPIDVMHGYSIPSAEAGSLGLLTDRPEVDPLGSAVAAARRPLLAYGAAVLAEIVRQGRPKEVVISALGVREGVLFERLGAAVRREDPLLSAARDMGLRARSPGHGPDLCGWTDTFHEAAGLDETADDRRLRHAACLMADVAWRAHPDARGASARDAIADGTFTGVDHPGRAFLALAVVYRHLGAAGDDGAPQLRALLTPQRLERARLLGAAMRVAYLVSSATEGVLPRTALRCPRASLTLMLPPDLGDLAGERCWSRLRQLGRLIGRDAEVRIG